MILWKRIENLLVDLEIVAVQLRNGAELTSKEMTQLFLIKFNPNSLQ